MDMLICSSLRFSWVIGAKDKHASFANAQEQGRRIIVRQMSSATTYGCLNYDIHAMFAAHRCASARG